MITSDVHGIRQFLNDYPEMSIAPSRGAITILKGLFSFSARPNGGIEINDSYYLKIDVPMAFPQKIPVVTELDGKIPRDGSYHINADSTLCLGSPMRLLQKISEKPSLVGFAEKCLVPYLYAISHKIRFKGDFAFNELAHGTQGIIDDYLNLFGLRNPKQVIKTLELLGKKRRIANKKPCPCECGLRLGKCKFHNKINKYRKMAYRSWFKKHYQEIVSDPHLWR